MPIHTSIPRVAACRRPLIPAVALLCGVAALHASVVRAASPRALPPPAFIATGAAYVDTFPGDPATVRYAAAAILINDGWRIALEPSSLDSLSTAWKPLKNLFVRMVFGNVQAQCRVGLRALDGPRTRVTFTASASTPRADALPTLRANGDRAYAKAARSWAAHMRRVLAGRDMPKPAALAAARLVSPVPRPVTAPPGSTE